MEEAMLSVDEVRNLLGVTEQAVRAALSKGRFKGRQVPSATGGGKNGLRWEIALSSLEPEDQAKYLLNHAPTPPPALAPQANRESLWDWYARKPDKAKEDAIRKSKILDAVLAMGSGRKVVELISAQSGESPATIYRWLKKVSGINRCDWLPNLVDGYTGKTKSAECSVEAWDFFKADYLRLEQPAAAACYERLTRAANEHQWNVPSLKTLERRIKSELPFAVRTLLRKGESSLMSAYPAQERSVVGLHALEWVNGDGYQHNVFCLWPDGIIGRPKTWFEQDVYSRLIVGHRTDHTENSDLIRLTVGDVIEKYGIPYERTNDNTRAAANKWLTGGMKHRYRFKVKEEEHIGLFGQLGITVHWTTVDNGRGHGQAKPIERTFGVGGMGEVVDKHPAFSGAWCGNNPTAKPEDYGSRAIPIDEFLVILKQEVHTWNNRPNRRTEICAGVKSFQQAFDESYSKSPIRKATAEQRHLWLLSAESVTVKHDGTVTLDAGGAAGFGKNRYGSDVLHEFGGHKVVVRFDPQNLQTKVFIYTLDGRFITEAPCIEKTGFGDTEAAREYARVRNQWRKNQRNAAKAEKRMDALAAAALLPDQPSADDIPVEATVIKLDFKKPITNQNKPQEIQEDTDSVIDAEALFGIAMDKARAARRALAA